MKKSGLTAEYLENLSHPNSLVRGQSYYLEGAVENVVKKGDVYKARVTGTRHYTVIVHEYDHDIEFFCDCPYNLGGICKHSVAVGLTIINGEFTVEKIRAKDTLLYDISKRQFFEKIFPAVGDEQKISFLKKLLGKHDEIRFQFLAFYNRREVEEQQLSIDEIREDVHKTIVNLDFSDIDYNMVDYSAYGGYMDQWEIDYDIAMDKIRDLFNNFETEMLYYLKNGSLVNGFRLLLGVYEGWFNIHNADNDDHYIFDEADYNYELETEFKYLLANFIQALEKTVYSETSIKKAIKLLFDRYHHYNVLETKVEDVEEEICYDLALFEDLTISLLTTQRIAEFTNELLETGRIDEKTTVHIRLKISEMLGDTDSWYRWAEKFAGIDYNVTMQLLERYDQSGNQDCFYVIARKAFSVWKDRVDDYLLSKVSPEVDHKFIV